MSSSRMGIERLLRPTSVAIVGASEKVGSFGASVLDNLLRAGYGGAIHLINPKRAEISGRPCVPSVLDLPMGVDCAVLAIPRAGVLDAVRQCVERGVGGAIVFSAGYSEAGEAGKAEQAELAALASECGIAIEGPNCLGMVNAVDGTALTFVTTPPLKFSAERGVGIVSQSGAMAAVLGVTYRHHALDLTYSVSTGNEAVTGVEDYVEFLLDEPHTQVIALLVEQFRQPGRFLQLARRAHELGKRIVLLHPGSSSAARASAATHTGAIAGDYDVMRAKVASIGVIQVETVEELVDVSQLLLRCRVMPSGGAAVLTESGAFKALTLDLCDRIGLPLPSLSENTAAALRLALPDFIPPSNPLDITAQGLVDPDLYRRTLPPLLADEAYGSIVLTIILTDEATGKLKMPPILHALSTFDGSKPIVFAGLDEGAWIDPAYAARLRELSVPFFPTAERAFRALARLTHAGRRCIVTPPNVVQATRLDHGTLTEHASKAILAAAGLRIPDGELATTVDEAAAIADRIGYPVVLKAQSQLLPHKTEAGGVILDVGNRDDLSAGWERLQSNIRNARPGIVLDGVLVEGMARRGGIELILGAKNDPGWGPVLLLGLGGVFAEALHAARLMVPGVSREDVLRELRALRGAVLLEGFRGSAAPDVNAIADLVVQLGTFVLQHPEITEIDLNPVMAYPEGVAILDALIVVD